MAKKKIITTGDLKGHKTTVPPSGGVVVMNEKTQPPKTGVPPKNRIIVMDEKTQPKGFDWEKMKRDAAKKKPATTNK